MMSLGSLPLSEKIYRSDKTLVSAQDLKVGDKILSLKITEDGINNVNDIITNYIQDRRSILNYELSEATVYSIEKHEKTYLENINSIWINQKQYIATKRYKNNESLIDTEDQKYFILVSLDSLQKDLFDFTTGKLVIKKLNPDFSSDLIDLFNEETILTKAQNATKRPSYSLTINNGHFYFTENFIVFGWILE